MGTYDTDLESAVEHPDPELTALRRGGQGGFFRRALRVCASQLLGALAEPLDALHDGPDPGRQERSREVIEGASPHGLDSVVDRSLGREEFD